MDGFSFLGLGDFTSLMVNIQIKDWGRTVLVDCVYNPLERLPYRIVFSNCEKIEWFFEKEQIDCIDNENMLDIIDFQIKEESNKNKASFFAYVVELLITCESITIEKDW